MVNSHFSCNKTHILWAYIYISKIIPDYKINIVHEIIA